MKVSEVRSGDIKARAGVIITDGTYVLACRPTPSSKWPYPKMDLPKGHIQSGEHPINAAIRECYEETNILFEPWKLNRPMKFMLDGEPLFLWEVRLSEMPPIDQLSCSSTFIDEATGQRHPEMAGYEYIKIYDGDLHSFQDRLRPCIDAYYSGNRFVYPFEDHRICADKINFRNGIYSGLRSAYYIKLDNGVVFKTIMGVKGKNIPCKIKILNGFIYYLGESEGQIDEDCQSTGSVAGDIPPNVSGTFSLGYKNGKFTPTPKKNATPQNFSSIPHF